MIIPKRRAVGLTATVAKTSAGAINYTPVAKVTNLTAAIKELKEKGFTFNMDTAAYFEDGRIKNVYLNGEYGGFAIHIMQK